MGYIGSLTASTAVTVVAVVLNSRYFGQDNAVVIRVTAALIVIFGMAQLVRKTPSAPMIGMSLIAFAAIIGLSDLASVWGRVIGLGLLFACSFIIEMKMAGLESPRVNVDDERPLFRFVMVLGILGGTTTVGSLARYWHENESVNLCTVGVACILLYSLGCMCNQRLAR